MMGECVWLGCPLPATQHCTATAGKDGEDHACAASCELHAELVCDWLALQLMKARWAARSA